MKTVLLFLLLTILGFGIPYAWYMSNERIEQDENIWFKTKPKALQPGSQPLPTGQASSTEEIIEESGITVNPRIVTYFTSVLQQEFVKQVGQPIEGFEPAMFKQIATEIIDEDFDGVEAAQGFYTFADGELAFILTEESEHSAARAITEKGMERLLHNLAIRFEISIKTGKDVDTFIETLR